jgi:hypothetical protein
VVEAGEDHEPLADWGPGVAEVCGEVAEVSETRHYLGKILLFFVFDSDKLLGLFSFRPCVSKL